MKSILSVFAGVVCLAVLTGNAFATADCAELAAELGESVKGEPAQVLVLVEEALKKSEACSCEIVKAAIEAAKADQNEELLKQIVIVALNAVESQAATIAECAVAAAPESVSAVKEAMRVAFGDSGDGNGLGEAPLGDPLAGTEDAVTLEAIKAGGPWAGRPVSVGGVYLIPPVALSASKGQSRALQELLPVADKKSGSSRQGPTTPPPVSPANGAIVRR
jgi:hypothetical protein